MPQVGKILDTHSGQGKVVSINVPKESVEVMLESGVIIQVPARQQASTCSKGGGCGSWGGKGGGCAKSGGGRFGRRGGCVTKGEERGGGVLCGKTKRKKKARQPFFTQ